MGVCGDGVVLEIEVLPFSVGLCIFWCGNFGLGGWVRSGSISDLVKSDLFGGVSWVCLLRDFGSRWGGERSGISCLLDMMIYLMGWGVIFFLWEGDV